MTALNVSVEELIEILSRIHAKGIHLVNMDITPNEDNPGTNKLIIQTVKSNSQEPEVNNDSTNDNTQRPDMPGELIFNPSIRTDNNDIFNILSQLV